ncbi:RDD family protein [Micromonospora sp. NPDC047548]|uniref:RDD family protein n=1 Tax=Micromonospora sp. NPDC047548 TaxID=3155624 RepID=UPI0033D9FF16
MHIGIHRLVGRDDQPHRHAVRIDRVAGERPGEKDVVMKRRLLAALLDYCVMLSWLAVLAALFVPLYLAGFAVWDDHPDLVAFVASVVPVWLYLTATESSAAGATWGKRRAGLRVLGPQGKRAHPARIAARNAVKLMPWQLAHLGVVALLSSPGAATMVSPANAWLPISATYAMVALTVTLMFVRDDHTALHDLIAGTRILATEPVPHTI